MDKTQASLSLKKLNIETASLTPSSLVVLYEIDIEDLATDLGLSLQENERIFRFHANNKLTSTSIFWQGKEFIAAPIKAEGFEMNGKGTLPTPRLSITTNAEGIPGLSLFKQKIRELGDLIGAKVTRIRTFAKYLDSQNFDSSTQPDGFSPDPNVEFPRDVYYIDRKTTENRIALEFELASLLDLEGIKLPGRPVMANRCPFSYRGAGCIYEYADRRIEATHGETAAMPAGAPPIANDKDELIKDKLGITSIKASEPYNSKKLYTKGDSVFITKSGLNYYFVAKDTILGKAPPNVSYWEIDSCSHTRNGCAIRFGTNGSMEPGQWGLVKGELPFGGFPGADKLG
jgi:lambda family phage minor tail protein L